MSRLRRLVLSDRFSFITCRLLRGRARLAEGRTAEFEKAELCAPRSEMRDSTLTALRYPLGPWICRFETSNDM
jgi:hypothetical protein